MMIKKKHKCTNSLIIDILGLLKSLGVSKVPSSWQRLKTLLGSNENEETKRKIVDQMLYFCPECEQESTNSNKCTNDACSYSIHPSIAPHKFLVMNVEKQLKEVLTSINANDIDLSVTRTSESQSIGDVKDGDVYSQVIYSLKDEHHRLFMSLTCNVDGAAIYTSSEQSMWIFIGCINELHRSIRFDIDKILGKK